MRNQEIAKKFEMDREFMELLGNNYEGEIPRNQLIDMCWNTAPSMVTMIILKLDSHPLHPPFFSLERLVVREVRTRREREQ